MNRKDEEKETPFEVVLKDVSETIESPKLNPALLYLNSLDSSHSRCNMRSRLLQIARILTDNPEAESLDLPWHMLRHQHIEAIKRKLVDQGKSPATVKLTLAALRGVLKAAFNNGDYSSEELLRANNVKSGRGSRLPRGRALSAQEIAALFAACRDGTPAGVRDLALFSLMYGAGLRREEVVKLQGENFNFNQRTLRIIGKGDKEREVPLPEAAVDHVSNWLKVRGNDEGAIFCRILRSGVVRRDMGLTAQGVYHILEKRYLLAGIEKCSPHDLRRTYATTLIDKKGDINLVRKLLGHSNIETTSKYDKRDEKEMRRAVEDLWMPV